MLDRIRNFAEEYDMLPQGGLVLAAVSGGRDSMCLLDLLLALRERGNFRLAVCHFNHQLRGAESRGDEEFVEKYCRRLGIEVVIGRGDVRARASALGESVEEAARVLRYAFFDETLERLGADRLVTAHHADDNVETFLINLVRGAGLQGLTGIPPRRDQVVRPLLCISHEEICAYAEERRIPYREDSSNERRDYLRNRLRHDVTPLLREMNPQLSRSVFKTTRLLRSDNDYLNARAHELFSHARTAEDNYIIAASKLAQAPDAVATRAVRKIFEAMGETPPAARLEDIVALARGDDPSAYLQLGNDLLVQRVYDDLLFTVEHDPEPPFAPVPLVLEGETALPSGGWRITCKKSVCPARRVPGVNYLSMEVMEVPLVVRSRQMGDEITLRAGSGTKTLKKLFIDEKIPRLTREVVPVIDRNGVVIAVGSLGADIQWHAKEGEACWELTIWKPES